MMTRAVGPDTCRDPGHEFVYTGSGGKMYCVLVKTTADTVPLAVVICWPISAPAAEYCWISTVEFPSSGTVNVIA